MSIGNTNSSGQFKNNFPWQKAVLELLTKIALSASPITGYALESTLVLIKTAVQSGSFYANNANFVAGDSGAITTTNPTIVIANPGVGLRVYITSVLVTNSHASTGTLVTLVDSGGFAIPGATGYAVSAGGGYSLTFPTPIKAPANTGIYAQNGTNSSNTYVSVTGFIGA